MTSRRIFSGLGVLAALVTLVGPAQAQTGKASAPQATAAGACAPLWRHTIDRLQDEKPQDLCQYSGRVVLVINTASKCGFAPQYEGLEALYRRYKDRGLVVLGFPSNDFGRQELSSNTAIADFCENTYGVQFPMFVKTSVAGAGAHPLYRDLAQRTGQWPRWNFHKYLVARDGQTIKAFASAVEPQDPALIKDIERMLSTTK